MPCCLLAAYLMAQLVNAWRLRRPILVAAAGLIISAHLLR